MFAVFFGTPSSRTVMILWSRLSFLLKLINGIKFKTLNKIGMCNIRLYKTVQHGPLTQLKSYKVPSIVQ